MEVLLGEGVYWGVGLSQGMILTSQPFFDAKDNIIEILNIV